MAIIKCKMCGGDLEVVAESRVAVCEYCGTQQTVPSADNEKKLTLFGRANRLRMACEFDKAAGVYESIVADFPEEAEAYWGLVLCKYGIEYVDDPATGKKIPTCHRSSFDSVMDDSNLEQALENADAIARRVYRDEAKAIEDLRKGIIEVSGKEDPYDIFICYKETDDSGDRTIDSVIAQEVYDALTEKGYRVFFSRITLEDKLGQEYEPYIFAALHSAKIMLAFGTDYEYYNAVWVKNEWSRFLQLIAAGEKKTLIPCYKNIDAYDMPKEFARLQAQDMGKVGAMQDLLRGIEKILGSKEQKRATINDAAAAQTAQENLTAPLIKRAFALLEKGDWKAADACCERLLDFDSECAEAYLGKLMAKLHIKQSTELQNSAVAFEDNPYYVKAVQFAEEKDNNILLAELKASAEAFRKKREQEEALIREKAEATVKRVKKVIPIVAAVAVIAIATILVVTKVIIPNGKYNDAVALMEAGNYQAAVSAFAELGGYKDSTQQMLAAADKTGNINFVIEKYFNSGASIKNPDILAAWQEMNAKTIDASGDTIVGVKNDGTVLAVGDDTYGQCDVSDWADIVSVALGPSHTVGLRSDGTVVAIGHNDFGQCNVDSWHDIVAISAGAYHTLGLQSNGTVVAVGNNGAAQCSVSGWTDIVKIAAGAKHSVGLKADGTVVGTGEHSEYDWRDITAICAGNERTLGVRSDGTVVFIGNGTIRGVAGWRRIVSADIASTYAVGLKNNGTLVAEGSREEIVMENTADWTDLVEIAAGDGFLVGVRENGTVLLLGWGVANPLLNNVSNWTNLKV